MSLGLSYLERKAKGSSKVRPISSEISLGNVRDGLVPMLHTLNVIKPTDVVVQIDFDWHNIKYDVCPITIFVKEKP